MKNEEVSYKTVSTLLKISQRHFTEYGYWDISLEKIAEEGRVTRGAIYHHFKNKQGLFTAVLECVHKDVSRQIEKEAMKSQDPWEQFIFGCVGFVKGANVKENKRILLVDAPAVLGWSDWRQMDQRNGMKILQEHINELKGKDYLGEHVDPKSMAYAVSGALNELALHDSQNDGRNKDNTMLSTITQLVYGFKKI